MTYEEFRMFLQNMIKVARLTVEELECDLDRFMILGHRLERGSEEAEEQIHSLMEKYLALIPLEKLNLHARVLNPLIAGGFQSVGQVLGDKDAEKLRRIRNFGPQALQVLARSLEEKGYRIPNGWKRYLPQE